MKKYEFTGEVKQWVGRTLHRIRATDKFGNVEAGELGGWIEKEENLPHDGNAWVYGDAQVCRQSHLIGVGPIGSRNDFTTFFRTKDLKIFVKCGCFQGDIDAFAEKVRATHGDNAHAREYMTAIELAKLHIDLGEAEEANGEA